MSTRQTMRRSSRSIPGAVALVVLLLSGMLGLTATAHAQEMADSYVVTGDIAEDGTLTITETITFAQAPEQLEQRLATTRQLLNYTQLEYEISDVTVTAGGTDLRPSLRNEGEYLVITVDTAQVGADPIEISYRVQGAAVALPAVSGQPDMTEVSWRLLQGLSVGVQDVRGEIALPAGARTNDINCQAGPPSNTVSCRTYASGTFEATYPQFTDGPRGPGEVVVLTFSLRSDAVAPNQVITERWTLDRAFSAQPLPLIAALAALLIGGAALFYLHRSRGTDRAGGAPTMVAQFEPVAAGEERFRMVVNMAPGQVGTLTDERVDPIDLAATIVDVAQRGHLTIIELPRTNLNHGATEWTFERGQGLDELHSYERTLVDALAPADGEPVFVSRISEVLGPIIPQVQDQIYEEVVDQGWFSARPDVVRAKWSRLGTIAVVASLVALGLLVALTRFGLLGLVLVGLAVGVLWVSQQMPRRTSQGSAALKGLQVLAMNLATQPTTHVPKDDAYAEISRIIPYAIVLGSFDRWLQALVDADDDPGVPDPDDLGWYRAPATWQLSDLPSSIDAFITTVEGKLYSRH